MISLNFLVQHLFINAAKKCKHKIALIVDSVLYTYQHIYKDCMRGAVYLKENGVKKGDRVLIQCGNSYDTVIAYWATLFCDAIACIIDAELTGDLLDNLINNLQPAFIANKNNGFCKHFNVGVCDLDWIFQNTEEDLAMIMHTSGSSGIPKGVMLSHRNIVAARDSISHYLQLTANDVVLSILPMHFDYGLYQMILAFSLGATLVLEKNGNFTPLIAKQIQRYQVTVLPCVPQFVQVLHRSSEQFACHFNSIKIVTNTGENLSKGHIQKIQQLFPMATLFSMYGLTECKRCSYVPPDKLSKKSTSIGIPMPNLAMWIQDSNGNRLPPNYDGELVISGPTVMQGYWNNPAETAKRIQINALGQRILRTGDFAVMDDEGYFYFKGRSDGMMKFKGAKFYVQDYVKKLETISALNRTYLYFHRIADLQSLIVCAEIYDKTSSDLLKKEIYALFPDSQKPDYVFYTNQFPQLSNGKLDKRRLEIIANQDQASVLCN